MSEEERDDIRKELHDIKDRQEQQSKDISRLCNVIISDHDAGMRGLGDRVKEMESKIDDLERYKRKSKLAAKWIMGALSFGLSFVLYYGKDILNFLKHVFTTGSTGKP